jgi:YihY family inner membrane protein
MADPRERQTDGSDERGAAGLVRRLDSLQRGRDWVGMPLAVVYKFFDDRGPYLAALVTYYVFVSLFPLLLLLFSALGFFLQGHTGLRDGIQNAALKDFPVIGTKLSHNVASLRGSGLGLASGVLGTLYGGLGAMQAAQVGFNQIYGVPRNEQPNAIRSRVRSVGLLTLLGSGVLLSTGIAVILSTGNDISQLLSPVVHAGGYLLSYLINVALFSVAFKLLTARDLHLRQVVTGGMIAAAAWMLLQVFGTSFVSARLHRTNAVYGIFAVVLATVLWLYLQSLILMLAAEINVVRQRRLWPRALLTPFTDDVELTPADRRAYEMYVATQRFKGFQTVSTTFGPAEAEPHRVRQSGSGTDNGTGTGTGIQEVSPPREVPPPRTPAPRQERRGGTTRPTDAGGPEA